MIIVIDHFCKCRHFLTESLFAQKMERLMENVTIDSLGPLED